MRRLAPPSLLALCVAAALALLGTAAGPVPPPLTFTVNTREVQAAKSEDLDHVFDLTTKFVQISGRRDGLIAMKPGEEIAFRVASWSGGGRELSAWPEGELRMQSVSVSNVEGWDGPYAKLMRHAKGASLSWTTGILEIHGNRGCGFKRDWFELTEDDLKDFGKVKRQLSLQVQMDESHDASQPCDVQGWTGSYTVGLNTQPPIPKDEISVEGPRCGCGKDALVELTALVERGGGEFEKFEVTVAGKGAKAEVLLNQGGKTNPKLRLRGSGKSTGKTNVIAVYKKDGKTLKSKPWPVSFCEVAKPELIDNGTWKPAHGRLGDALFDGNDPGHTELWAKSRDTFLNAEDAKDQVKLELEGDTENLFRSSKDGDHLVLAADRLPSKNESFGIRKMKSVVESDGCECRSETVETRLFFQMDASNHGAGDKAMRNWAWYWRDTSANRTAEGKKAEWQYVDIIPANRNGGTPNAGEVARYEPYGDIVYLSRMVADGTCKSRPDGPGDEGIDCFAVSIRHESRHKKELTEWWPASLRDKCTIGFSCSGVDDDGDMVPNGIEEKLGCDPQRTRSCPGLPPNVGPIQDMEYDSYATGWSWVQKSAESEDWACPGQQCKDNRGYINR